MFFDIGWSELLLISVVALIVVGPKDLPVLLRAIGRYVGIVRNHAQEFRNQFEQAMRESELESLKDEMTELRDDVRSSVENVRTSIDDTNDTLSDAVDDTKKATKGHEFQSRATAPVSEKDLAEPSSQRTQAAATEQGKSATDDSSELSAPAARQ